MDYQNDERWKNTPINRSSNTLGEVGCLVTSLSNIYNIRNKDGIMTPAIFNDLLLKKHGYTKDNYVIWAKASDILNAEIKHIYSGDIEFDINSYYVVNFLNFGAGHFCNLISKEGDKYNIFDVWDGKYKTINKPRRLVKITFAKEKL